MWVADISKLPKLIPKEKYTVLSTAHGRVREYAEQEKKQAADQGIKIENWPHVNPSVSHARSAQKKTHSKSCGPSRHTESWKLGVKSRMVGVGNSRPYLVIKQEHVIVESQRDRTDHQGLYPGSALHAGIMVTMQRTRAVNPRDAENGPICSIPNRLCYVTAEGFRDGLGCGERGEQVIHMPSSSCMGRSVAETIDQQQNTTLSTSSMGGIYNISTRHSMQ